MGVPSFAPTTTTTTCSSSSALHSLASSLRLRCHILSLQDGDPIPDSPIPSRQSAPCQMVYHSVAQGQGQNRQGRLAARPRPPDAHVQLYRIQRYENRVSSLRVPLLHRRSASEDNELITLEIIH